MLGPDIEIERCIPADDRQKLGLWLVLSEHAGWWEPYENVVMACEPPVIQKTDAAGRLHCDDGPAILCRDGWPVYAWHGVRVEARCHLEIQNV